MRYLCLIYDEEKKFQGMLKSELDTLMQDYFTFTKEIRDSGVTIFYVSHAAGSVRRICDRVLVLEKGVLGFDGDVDAGIKYVKYDDESEGTDEELGSDV